MLKSVFQNPKQSVLIQHQDAIQVEKGLWGLVDGTDSKPTDPTTAAEWTAKDARVKSWLLQTMDSTIVVNLRPYKTAKAMWEYLKKVYDQESSARRFHLEAAKGLHKESYVEGLLYEAKGLHKEAVKSFVGALDIDPTHVPSLISTAVALRRFGNQSNEVVRSLLMDALRLDRMNSSAWYNLGLLYKDEGAPSCIEAAECHGQLLNLVFAIGRMLDW